MPFSYYSYILSPDDQSCILPLVLPPTTLSTIFGCEAVTVGTAVTLNSGNQLTLHLETAHSRKKTHSSVQSATIFSPVAETTSKVLFIFPTVKCGMYSIFKLHCALKIVNHLPVWQLCLTTLVGLKPFPLTLSLTLTLDTNGSTLNTRK